MKRRKTMHKGIRHLFTAICFLACASMVFAEVEVAPVFGDNTVLQRELTVPILVDTMDNPANIAYGVHAACTVVIDRDGKLVYRNTGARETQPEEADKVIKGLLESSRFIKQEFAAQQNSRGVWR
jgi:hypothetical protein